VVQVLASPNTSTSQGIFITLPTDTLDAPGTVSIDMSQLFNGRALKEDHLYFYRVSDPYYASLYQDDPLDIFIPNDNYFNTHLGHVLGQGWVSGWSLLYKTDEYRAQVSERINVGGIDRSQGDAIPLDFSGTISVRENSMNGDDLGIGLESQNITDNSLLSNPLFQVENIWDLFKLIAQRWQYYFGPLLILLIFMRAAFQFILAQGDAEKLTLARHQLQWAFVGLAFILLGMIIILGYKDIVDCLSKGICR